MKHESCTEFVTCYVCGAKKRHITYNHVAMHGYDLESYMQEFGITDRFELITESARVARSSRKDYLPLYKDELLSALLSVYEEHGRINREFVEEHYYPLFRQSLTIWKSWDIVVEAIGLDPNQVRGLRAWTRESVIEALRKEFQDGKVPYEPLHKRNLSLGQAAVKRFGSIKAALKAAGLTPIDLNEERKKSTDKLLNELRAIFKRRKRRDKNCKVPASLDQMLRMRFGTVAKALEAAGIEPNEFFYRKRGWSKAEVISSIRARIRAGKSLELKVVRREDQALVVAATRYHRGWYRALSRASCVNSS